MNPSVDPTKLADVQALADKLAGLPNESLLYVAGYVDGVRGQPRTGTYPPDREKEPGRV